MSGPRSIEFAGTDEELEKHLLEFARATGGWAARDPKRGGWAVSSGSLLSTNPNTLAWRIRVRREAAGLTLHPSAIALPWTRRKVARLVAFREGQLADYLTSRVRGKGAGTFDAVRLREPFAPYGSGAAALTASFAWVVASGLLGLAAACLAASLASLPLMLLAAEDVVERARIVEESGGLSLPPRAEREAMGLGSALGAAVLFGLPLGFLSGVLHSLALASGEAWTRAARLPQASFLFLWILGTAAFFGRLPFLAVPLGLLAPAGAQLGYTLLWSRRGERVREGGRAKPLVVGAGVLLAAGLLAGAVPAAARGAEFNDRLALFRDRALLGTGLGKSAARFYYRHTLLAAEPLKEFYAPPGSERPSRGLRTARAASPADQDVLRSLGFVVVPDRVAGPVDVVWQPPRLHAGESSVEAPSSTADLRQALDGLSREAFRGGTLRDVHGLALGAVYYLGPAAGLLVFAAICCPGISIMYRAMSPKSATIALLCCLFSTAGLMLLGSRAVEGITDTLDGLRKRPTPERIAEGLAHSAAPVRHEAAYRAFRLDDVPASLADPLLRASADADLRVRLWAAAALGKTRDPRALRALLERLDDQEFFVRYRAAEGLGLLGNPDAAERLRRMLREGTWYEGLYALKALRRIERGGP